MEAMTRRGRFVQHSLERLIKKDDDIGGYFKDERGGMLDTSTYRERRKQLEQSIERGYKVHGARYGKSNIAQKFVAEPLRYAAFGTQGLAAAYFIPFPPAAFGLSKLGLLASKAADAIDYASYIRQDQLGGKELAKTAGESVANTVLGYFPVTGLIDAYRGRRKFEKGMEEHLSGDIDRIVNYAKADFKNKMKAKEDDEGRKVIPISEFRDPQYAESENELRKAA